MYKRLKRRAPDSSPHCPTFSSTLCTQEKINEDKRERSANMTFSRLDAIDSGTSIGDEKHENDRNERDIERHILPDSGGARVFHTERGNISTIFGTVRVVIEVNAYSYLTALSTNRPTGDIFSEFLFTDIFVPVSAKPGWIFHRTRSTCFLQRPSNNQLGAMTVRVFSLYLFLRVPRYLVHLKVRVSRHKGVMK